MYSLLDEIYLKKYYTKIILFFLFRVVFWSSKLNPLLDVWQTFHAEKKGFKKWRLFQKGTTKLNFKKVVKESVISQICPGYLAWIKKMNINHNIIICKTILTRNSPVHQPKNRCCSFSTAFQWRQHEIQSCQSWIFDTFLSVSGDPSPWKVPPQLNSVNRNILILISRFISTIELVFNLYHLANH